MFSIFTFPYYAYKYWKKDDKSVKTYLIVSGIGLAFSILGLFTDNDTSLNEQPNEVEEQVQPEENTSKTEVVEEPVEEDTEVGDDTAEEADETDEEKQTGLADDVIKQINENIANHIEQDQGFALGTLDRNGQPTDDGEPNPDFAWSLFVHELTYDGNDLEMQTDAGFLDLSQEERDQVAHSAQSTAGVYIGDHEDWEAVDYQNSVFLTVYNGQNVLGHSKILNKREFTWNDL